MSLKNVKEINKKGVEKADKPEPVAKPTEKPAEKPKDASNKFTEALKAANETYAASLKVKEDKIVELQKKLADAEKAKSEKAKADPEELKKVKADAEKAISNAKIEADKRVNEALVVAKAKTDKVEAELAEAKRRAQDAEAKLAEANKKLADMIEAERIAKEKAAKEAEEAKKSEKTPASLREKYADENEIADYIARVKEIAKKKGENDEFKRTLELRSSAADFLDD